MKKGRKIGLIIILITVAIGALFWKDMSATYLWYMAEHVGGFPEYLAVTPDTELLILPERKMTYETKSIGNLEVPMIYKKDTIVRTDSATTLVIMKQFSDSTYAVLQGTDLKESFSKEACAVMGDHRTANCLSNKVFVKKILEAQPGGVDFHSPRETKVAVPLLLFLKKIIAPESTQIQPFNNGSVSGFLFHKKDGDYFAIVIANNDTIYNILFEQVTEAEMLNILAYIK